MRNFLTLLLALLVVSPNLSNAQERIASPRGEAATQVGGSMAEGRYTGGSWVVVEYGRPILRGRTNIFGSGDSYGKMLQGDGEVWRAGANKSTRFSTEIDLVIGGKRLAAGEYSLFIDLKEGAWTLVISNHKAKSSGDSMEEGIWGAYEYQMEMDVLRTPMMLSKNSVSVDQMTFLFVGMTGEKGTMVFLWENEMAMVDFSVAR
ncbi:MAG: DUF2911 domain-containing protein [Bacteroidetes bacterium]|nr:DUF2911 domain-containing protein [Bacteroidota bacterium]